MAKIQGEKILRKRVERQLAEGKLAGVHGDRAIIAKLNELGKQSTINKMLRPGVREAASKVRKRAQRLVIEETGTLRRSIGSKSLTVGGQVVMAIVGPRRGMARDVERTMPDGSRVTKRADPALYAHLVEFGTAHSPAHPFMRPAWDGTNSKKIIARRTQSELRKLAQGRVGKVKADKAVVKALKKAGGK